MIKEADLNHHVDINKCSGLDANVSSSFGQTEAYADGEVAGPKFEADASVQKVGAAGNIVTNQGSTKQCKSLK